MSANAPVGRTVRVGAEVAHALADLIERELADPRLRLITVTGVDMSPDLKLARIKVSSADPGASPDVALKALRHAGSRLRQGLAGRIKLRVVPRLDFAWDHSGEAYRRLDALIARGLPSSDGADG